MTFFWLVLLCGTWFVVGWYWGVAWESRKTRIQHERYLAGLAVVAKQIRENERTP